MMSPDSEARQTVPKKTSPVLVGHFTGSRAWVPTGASATHFSPGRFLSDLRSTSAAIGAEYSEPITRSVVDAFAESFSTGAVLWKTTDRPGDRLSYRFYSRGHTDTVAIAARAGLLAADNTLIRLVESWSGLFNCAPEQSCDFDADRGLAKTWIYLGGTRPLDEVLGADDVPDTVRRHVQLFHRLGLSHVRFTAVDYRHETVNLYFRAPRPLTAGQFARITGIVQAPPADPRMVAEISEFLPRNAYTLAVTIGVRTGALERVCFYAPKLPAGRFPAVGERLGVFFTQAPSYDADEANVAAWSFGARGGTYYKGERSYCGDLAGVFRRWATFFSTDTQYDAALQVTGGVQ